MELPCYRGGTEAWLGGEPIEVTSNVADQHVGQVASEAVAHHHALHHQILAIGRHAIGRNLPAAIAQTVGEIVERPMRLRRG